MLLVLEQIVVDLGDNFKPYNLDVLYRIDEMYLPQPWREKWRNGFFGKWLINYVDGAWSNRTLAPFRHVDHVIHMLAIVGIEVIHKLADIAGG